MRDLISAGTNLRRLAGVLGFLLLMSSFPVMAQTAGQKTADDKRQEIESIIRDYLLKNPAIIREALQALEAQEAAAAAEARRKVLSENRDALLQGASGTTLGNPKGDVTIFVFFDYQCGYCRQLEPVLEEMMTQDPGLRLVMKDFPILGPESLLASKVALAASARGQYPDFFRAFLKADGLDAGSIDAIAARFGWTDATSKVVENKAVDEMLEANYALANRLSLTGTPVLVIGDQLIEGAASIETLTALVAAERAKRPDRNSSHKAK